MDYHSMATSETKSSHFQKEYWGIVWSKRTTNKGTGNPILTYFLRGGDLIVKFPKIVTNVTFGKGLIF